jgi:sec-independent protein translocase protein TatB
VFDIGIGEILLIAVAGLLIFGPEKLPRAAADAAKWIKQIRAMAAKSRQDLVDSAGIDLGDTVETVKSLGDLHPRKLARSFIEDDPEPPSANGAPKNRAPGTAAPGTTAPAPVFDPDAT